MCEFLRSARLGVRMCVFMKSARLDLACEAYQAGPQALLRMQKYPALCRSHSLLLAPILSCLSVYALEILKELHKGKHFDLPSRKKSRISPAPFRIAVKDLEDPALKGRGLATSGERVVLKWGM